MAEIEDGGRALRIVDEKDLRFAFGLMDEAKEALSRDNMRMLIFTLGRMREVLSDMRWNSPEVPPAPTAENRAVLCGGPGCPLGPAPPIGSFEWVLMRIRTGTAPEKFRRHDWTTGMHLGMTNGQILTRYNDGEWSVIWGYDMMQNDWEEME